MFHNKLNWIFNLSGMTHLALSHDLKDNDFWSQLKSKENQKQLNIKDLLHYNYSGMEFENIKLFKNTMCYKPFAFKSRLNHILFTSSPAKIFIEHLPQINFDRSGILIADSLFPVECKSEWVLSAIIKKVSESLEFRILNSYIQSVGFFDNKGWGQEY